MILSLDSLSPGAQSALTLPEAQEAEMSDHVKSRPHWTHLIVLALQGIFMSILGYFERNDGRLRYVSGFYSMYRTCYQETTSIILL